MTNQKSADFAARGALGLAITMAALGCTALSIEFGISLHESLGEGYGLAIAVLRFLRYFTILTNVGLASLTTVTAWRLWCGRPLPPAALYAAGVTYSLVVGITYEALLRRLWSPHGVQFYTDMTMHDIIPTLTLVFWLAFAPKRPLAWSGPLRWLTPPAAYFGVTLIAGLFGAHYPYGFLDPDKRGYAAIFITGLVFLAAFYGLGLALVAASRRLSRAPR